MTLARKVTDRNIEKDAPRWVPSRKHKNELIPIHPGDVHRDFFRSGRKNDCVSIVEKTFLYVKWIYSASFWLIDYLAS